MDGSAISDTEISDLLQRAAAGDDAACGQLFRKFHARLERMVRLRMNRRIQGRVDSADVLQDAYLEASQKLAEYVSDPPLPFYLWLRHITGQKLIDVHRRHLGAQMRNAGLEVPDKAIDQAISYYTKMTAPSGQVAGTKNDGR